MIVWERNLNFMVIYFGQVISIYYGDECVKVLLSWYFFFFLRGGKLRDRVEGRILKYLISDLKISWIKNFSTFWTKYTLFRGKKNYDRTLYGWIYRV